MDIFLEFSNYLCTSSIIITVHAIDRLMSVRGLYVAQSTVSAGMSTGRILESNRIDNENTLEKSINQMEILLFFVMQSF